MEDEGAGGTLPQGQRDWSTRMITDKKSGAGDAPECRGLLPPALASPYACISLFFLDITHTVTSVYEAFPLFTYKYCYT